MTRPTTPCDLAGIGLLLQAELRTLGHDTTHEGDHLLRPDDGAVFGLASVTAACRQAPRSAWARIVGEHARRLTVGLPRPDLLETLTLEEARAGVHLRLQPLGALPWPESMTYARPVAPGLVEVLMHKHGDALAQLTDPVVDRLGLETLRELGLANLVASPMGSLVPHRLTGGGEVLVLRGESAFTASRVLALPDVLRRTVGAGEEVPLPHGALVCMPERHTLGLHVLGHRNGLRALRWLTSLGLDDHDPAPYPLSPFVYWWHEGRLTEAVEALSDPDSDFSAAFETVLGRTVEEALDDLVAGELSRRPRARRPQGRHRGRRH